MSLYTGDTVRLVAEFATFEAMSIDPTTITVRHQDPDGVITTSTYPGAGWTHPLTGTYYFDVAVPTAGTWQYSFEGTGVCDVYDNSSFVVHERAF